MVYDIIITPIELIVDWVFSFFIVKIPQLGVIGASYLSGDTVLPTKNKHHRLEPRLNSRNATFGVGQHPQVVELTDRIEADPELGLPVQSGEAAATLGARHQPSNRSD